MGLSHAPVLASHPSLEAALLAVALLVALWFKPWQVLRHRPLQSPWIGALVILPWAWWTQKLLPSGMALHLSGTCLLVLMFGWPMAMVMVVPIGLAAALLDIYGPQQLGRVAAIAPLPALPDWSAAGALLMDRSEALITQALWMGVMPATLGLAIGLMMRRWLPRHLFIYILGRGFITTALSITLTGALGLLALPFLALLGGLLLFVRGLLLQLLRGLGGLGRGYPLLVGLSRKSMLGVLTGRDIADRMSPSVVAALLAVQRGAAIVRVHDVRETADAIKLWRELGERQ